MRIAVLFSVAVAACAGQTNPPVQVPATDNSVLGCWDIATVNFKSSHLPNGTKVRLDSSPSKDEPGYNQLQRLTPPPVGVVEERNYWYISAGDRHVKMKLGTVSSGVSLDFVPSGDENRLHGRADAGASVTATRTSCSS